MESKYQKIEGSPITYIDEGEGQPIVLLHGFCGSSRYWEEVLPELSKTYRVIAPDLPGHGQSDSISNGTTIEKIAESIKAVIDELKLGKVTMFGHSLGGYITLAFADKYANQLNGFSLVHSTAFPDSDEAKKGRTANVEKVEQQGIHSLIDGLVPKLFAPEHNDKNYVETAKKIGYETTSNGAIHALQAMKDRPDRNYVLKETELPVLLLAGEQDQIIPAEKTFSVTKPKITHTIIKDAGHMSMYENPQELIRVMKEFLSRFLEQ
ncbi:alpha/beta fold hydrolase [Bacillus sp. SORGH_AS_0510]|uniref:alpha/beta fold hydrolase n=1 Tax=Bacillus sp. SORGH_AS_0510 TaxID=3041771 RepID=UPI0027D834CE|nr:alpha/beta hydrolase [Bacillus sp. SORGH_AS_0510]